MTSETQARENMNNMYRWTRHVYDASRKYYLLGRDYLIRELKPKADEHIIEVGCGTARNLRKLVPLYPDAHFYGLDASDEMLKTADRILKNRGIRDDVQLAQGLAQNFDPIDLFKLSKPADKIVFSYSLSIIPPWKDSIDHALELLPLGGELHIVDFGGQEELPKWFRAFLFWWLKIFHVYHKPEILEHLQSLEKEGKGALNVTHLYKGYAYRAVFTKA